MLQWVANNSPARWIHAHRLQDAGLYGQVMGTQASQKSTAVGWSRSGGWALLFQPPLWKCVQRIFRNNIHCQSSLEMIIGTKKSTLKQHCAKKSRVEPTRCRNLRAGWEKALQCRQFCAMGIAARTFCRTDAVSFYTFFVWSHKTMLYWNYKSQDKQWNLMICVLRLSVFIATCVALQRSQHLRLHFALQWYFSLLTEYDRATFS